MGKQVERRATGKLRLPRQTPSKGSGAGNYHHHGQNTGEIRLRTHGATGPVFASNFSLGSAVSATERLLDVEDKAKPSFCPPFESLRSLTGREWGHIGCTFISSQTHVLLSCPGFPV